MRGVKMKWYILGIIVIALLVVSCTAQVPSQPVKPVQNTPVKPAPTVKVADNPTYGKILVDSKGMTLYTFAIDKPGESVCLGQCVVYWPLLTVAAGTTPTSEEVLPKALGSFQRADGTNQVMYDNWPLYYFARDKAPGDALGHNVNGSGGFWYVVKIE
jgi:predicted lipoprotein with Yx(FWY)xxD motif